MAIEGINALSGLKRTDRVEADRKAGKKSEPEQGAASDSVDITNGGISTLASKLESIPDVRESKIAELQEQIKNGTYKVPSENLAEIILDELV
jgi:flagellar biosynthesis anti-sigma factor FlgM